MTNPIKITTTFAVAILLGGCNNLLYSDSVAPVYSKTQSAGQPANAPRQIGGGSQGTVSIENPGQPAVVNQAQNNPYARGSSNPIIRPVQPAEPIIRPPTADNPTPNPMDNTASNSGVAVQQSPVASANAGIQNAEQVLSESAKAARSNDPRIREASEVLNAEKSTMTASAASIANKKAEAEKLAQTAEQVAGANRPTAVKEAAVRRAEAAKQAAVEAQRTAVQKTTQRVNATTQSVTQGANEVKATASAAASTAVAGAESATAAVTPPKPASPSSATKALLKDARTAVAAGNYEKAASSLERAHRIQPGNAKILYDIAQIRYAQGKYRQAESFASKAANYAKSSTLSKKIWTILANSRRALGNTSGADAAAKKAANF